VNFEIDIVTYAKSVKPITDLVGRRIYGLYREPNAPLPQLLIMRTNTQRQPLYCRTSNLVAADFQLDSYGLTGQDATGLAKVVRKAFMDFTGMMGDTSVNRVFLTNEFPKVDPEPGDISITQLFTIWYLED
jgi:hypothetical protein